VLTLFTPDAGLVPITDIVLEARRRGVEIEFRSRLGSTGADDWELGTFHSPEATVEASSRMTRDPELEELCADVGSRLASDEREALLTARREYRLEPADEDPGLAKLLAEILAGRVGGLLWSDVDDTFKLLPSTGGPG
jgi:hypothetical protein